MSEFPRLTIEGVTLPRVICGTNALLGFSHVSPGRDAWIREHFTAQRIAKVFARCQELGANAVMGPLFPRLLEALAETEKLTGQRPVWVATTSMEWAPPGQEEAMKAAFAAGDMPAAMGLCRQTLMDQVAALKAAGAPFCLIHGSTVDHWPISDGVLEGLPEVIQAIRDAGMVPGAVTHLAGRLAEVDRGPHDLALLGTPVNQSGWVMSPSRDAAIEVVSTIKRPLIAIKTLACGRYPGEHDVENWLNWAADVPGVQAIALGVMVEQEAEQSVPILRKRFATKFGS